MLPAAYKEAAAVLWICMEKMWMQIQENILMWMWIHALTELWRAK
jgi:hypothetical protein